MSEIQESYALLMQIDKLLADIELKIQRIEGETPKLERNLNTFRQLERLAIRWLVLAKRMGLPDDVDGAITKIARLVVMIRMAHISINMMMATNPVTAAIGIAGLMGTVMTSTDVLVGY